METVVLVEGSNEGKFEETGLEKNNSALSSPKHVADPVVYKLVRVEGDGRLVPATDDELMEVEGLLENEKREIHIVADTGQALGCTSNEVSSSGIQLESSEGLSQSENTEADAEKLSARLEGLIFSDFSLEDTLSSFIFEFGVYVDIYLYGF
ncbi:hypothetical protein QQP08_019484 [Theobroma cacao]|nr:hypothetical protein QQP08_019484 [Theobroma cacao]